LQELFRYERVGFDANGRVVGYFTGCDVIPTFYEDLRAVGADLDLKVFAPVERQEQADERRA